MKRISLCLLSLVLLVGTSYAQRPQQRGGKKSSASEQVARQLATRFELDESQTEWFVPLFVSYSDTLQALSRELYNKPLKANPTEEEIQKAAKKNRQQIDFSKLSAEESQILIQRSFELQAKSLQIRHAYYQIFSARISPQKLLPLFVQPSATGTGQGGRGPQSGYGRPGGYGAPRGGGGWSMGGQGGGGF